VHSRNRKSIHPAGETVLNLYFDTSGRDEIRVRSIGCGEISPWSVLEVDVQPMPDNNDHTMAFELLPDVNQGQISLTIPDSESPPFQVIIKNLYGKTLFKKSYNMPGKYILPLLREYHDSGILLVQISNSQKSLCKKISIFKPD